MFRTTFGIFKKTDTVQRDSRKTATRLQFSVSSRNARKLIFTRLKIDRETVDATVPNHSLFLHKIFQQITNL